MKKSMMVLFATLIMVVTFTGAATAETSQTKAISCYAASCEGLDPSTTTCANDARTVRYREWHTVMIQLRYSPSCRSAWARIVGAAPGYKLWVENNYGGFEENEVTSGFDAFTHMVNDAGIESRACASPKPGCTDYY